MFLTSYAILPPWPDPPAQGYSITITSWQVSKGEEYSRAYIGFWGYDLGAGATKLVRRMRYYARNSLLNLLANARAERVTREGGQSLWLWTPWRALSSESLLAPSDRPCGVRGGVNCMYVARSRLLYADRS